MADTEETATLGDIGMTLDRDNLGKVFKANINGKSCTCIARFVEGYNIIAVVPTHEVQSFRDRAAITNTLTEIIISIAQKVPCIFRECAGNNSIITF